MLLFYALTLMDISEETNNTDRIIREYCPVCMGTNFLFERKVRDHISHSSYSVHHCKDCSARFISDPPSPDTMPQHYANPSGDRMRRKEEGVHYKLRNMLLKDELKPLLKRLPGGSGIIDFGTGDGAVSSFLKGMGFNPLALDMYPPEEWPCPDIEYRQVDLNIPFVPLVDSTGTRKPAQAVVMRHVLEHLYDPAAILSSMRDADIDYVLIISPNYRSIMRPLLGEYWYYWDPPRHLTYFTRHSLYCLAERAGYRLLDTTTYAVDEAVTSLHRYMLLHGGNVPETLAGKIARLTNPKSPLAAVSSVVSSFFGNCIIHALLEKYKEN